MSDGIEGRGVSEAAARAGARLASVVPARARVISFDFLSRVKSGGSASSVTREKTRIGLCINQVYYIATSYIDG